MKDFRKSTSIIPNITLSFIFLFMCYFEDVLAAPPTTRQHILCRPEQRDALLAFKNEFHIGEPNPYCSNPYRKTESWANNSDCCSWKGITCNAKSGDVVGLDLSFNDLNGQIPSSIGNLSYLTTLKLSVNNFSGQIPSSIRNFSYLTTLKLSVNNFSGRIPSWIGNLTQLTSLQLSLNQFSGQIPSWIGNLTQLTSLDLSFNQLSGQFPSSIGNLFYLTDFDLSGNYLVGEIPSSIGKLSHLTSLDLSQNNFNGRIPSSIGNLTQLTSLELSFNQFSNQIPSSIGNQHGMKNLDISNNKIEGQVPACLWTLPKLEFVNLSNNTFIGFQSSNKKQGLSSVQKPSMRYLLGSNNNFTGKIPSFICSLRSLNTLDLSENKFNGSIPRCMGNLRNTLSVLNLRRNHLRGRLPINIFKRLRSFDVGHNQLVGKLPRSLNSFSTLEVLNVESNRINDTFPFWLGSLQKLQVLVLRSNAFHGPIHQASFPQLRIIDISHNHFVGTLPSDYFSKWTAMSSLGKNEVGSDEMYMRGQSRYYYDSLVLMNKGVEMEMVRILKILTAIDFSGNKFEGEIPKSIDLLKELHVLNLSNNAFTGHIPSSIGNLTSLESLDVSQNKLSGEIPQELGELSFLAYMNFSHNQFSGLVPGGNQFQTQHCSSFGDNPGLVGSSLDKVCRDIHTPPASHQHYETPGSEDEDEEEVISWIAAAIGFVPGIVSGLTFGYILVSHKPEWFMNPFGRNNRRRRSTTTH